MSDHIPFEIQSEIMKRLPVKSLIQFRSVSRQWKSFIDSPKFINNYHINHTNPQHHLLVQYELDRVQTYTSIIDNNTFPQQKFPLTAPESIRSLRDTFILDSVNGLLCLCHCYGGFNRSIRMVVIWNPTIRKSVDIVFTPKVGYTSTYVGFGVCPDTSNVKLVKISVAKIPSMWEVDVYNLSTRVWKTIYTGVPFKSCTLAYGTVFVDGVIYFSARDDMALGLLSNCVISFDLKSEKFGEVCLPERLVDEHNIAVTKVNGSLGLLKYYDEDDMRVCGVWMRKDGANKTFSKIYTVKVEAKSFIHRVLAFRNNSEAVMELTDDHNYMESRIEVYEPLCGHTIGVGINGKTHTFFASSYTETLLLLDQSDSNH